jgi:4-hydroxy-2-oxoglutarate aldolase
VPEGFSVLTGHGSTLMAALGAGAVGAILAVGCFAPRTAVEVYRAFSAADYERGYELQRRLALLVRHVMSRYGIGGIKTAMNFIGLEGGRVRAPLSMPNVDARLEIKKLLEDSGALREESGGETEGQRFGAGAK